MSNILKVKKDNLIIKKENETYFINYTEDKKLKFKQEFITSDGYEVGINLELEKEEIKELAKMLNEIVSNSDNKDFVAYGENLSSDIHFVAKDLDDACHWANQNVGQDVDVLPLEIYEIKEKKLEIYCDSCEKTVTEKDVTIELTNNGSGKDFTMVKAQCDCKKVNLFKGLWGHGITKEKAINELKEEYLSKLF